jgi:uncharacterized protein
MSWSRRVLRLLLIVCLTPVLFLLCCQSKVIYHPNPNRAESLQELSRLRGVSLGYVTSQGRQQAYLMPPRLGGMEAAPLWLCFAGNGSLALDWLPMLGLWDEKHAYLLVDYPAYGACEGSPTPQTIRENIRGAFTALAAHLKVDEASLRHRSQVLGHSLGAAAALMAAEELELSRAVLLSPFTTMTEMGRLLLGWPLCLLNQHRFDNERTLRVMASRAGARAIIFHGSEDEVIPVAMGRSLAEVHPAVVSFHELPGVHHNDILMRHGVKIGEAMRQMASP